MSDEDGSSAYHALRYGFGQVTLGVGGDHHAIAHIHRFCRRRDFALAPLDIVFWADADGAQMGLRADHMLHRRDELLGEAAMRDKNQTDHECSI